MQTCTFDLNLFIQIMVKSLIMAKYVWEQKYMRVGTKNRKSPNRGLIRNPLRHPQLSQLNFFPNFKKLDSYMLIQ